MASRLQSSPVCEYSRPFAVSATAAITQSNMKSVAVLFFLCLAALVFGPSCDAATTARPKATKTTASKCGSVCTDSWDPVCGKTDTVPTGVTFGNPCVLEKAICESGKSITKLNNGECANKNAPVRLS